ncbi:MAG: MlaE family lipid ABC transporter permease subunit [Pseudomonadota bacterium]
MAAVAAQFQTDVIDGVLKMRAIGDWRARHLGAIDAALRVFEDDSVGRELVIDVSDLSELDTAGAMVIQRVLRACTSRSDASTIVGATPVHQELLEQVRPHLAPCPVAPLPRNAFVLMLRRLGLGVVDFYFSALQVLSFVGLTLAAAMRVVRVPTRFRITSTAHHMEEAGINAIPIVGLMSFLIGAVVAFMGARVLQAFNASIFTVELVGIAVMREFGVLLAAILLAGRSGSAFTAQIGSMKIREEIDAMTSLGLNPIEVLVLPRVIALVIMLPLLAFLGAMLGLTGGLIVAWGALDIPPALFMARLQDTVGMQNLYAGIIKAPFFAFVIAVIGCFQGLQVEGSAESLGQRTTLSVVQALFMVIVLDAFFAMFFLEIDF